MECPYKKSDECPECTGSEEQRRACELAVEADGYGDSDLAAPDDVASHYAPMDD